MKSKYFIPVVALTALLAGCKKPEASSPAPSSPEESISSSPVDHSLKASDLYRLGNDNITLEGTTKLSTTNSSNVTTTEEASLVVKVGEEAYSAAVTQDESTTEIGLYKNDKGLATVDSIDKDNNVVSTATSYIYDKTTGLHNYLDDIGDSVDFFDKEGKALRDGSYKYVLSEDGLADEATNKVFLEALDTLTFAGGYGPTFFDDQFSDYYNYGYSLKSTLSSAYIVKKDDSIQIAGEFEFDLVQSSKTVQAFTVDFTISPKDVGVVAVRPEDVKLAPYAVPSGKEAEYKALGDAIQDMKTKNYTFSAITGQEQGAKFATLATYDGRIVSNGYSLKETMDGSSSYSGVHYSNNMYQLYESSEPTGLVGMANYREAPARPGFDFAKEIFEVGANDAKGNYTFTLRPTATVAEVANEIDPLGNGATGYSSLKLVVSPKGALVSADFDFVYEEQYLLEESLTYSDIDDSDVIPTSIADFTGFVDYVAPTAASGVTVTDEADGTTTLTLKKAFDTQYGEDALPDFFGSATFKKDFFLAIYDSAYNDGTETLAIIQLQLKPAASELKSDYAALVSELKTLGYTLTAKTTSSGMSFYAGSYSKDSKTVAEFYLFLSGSRIVVEFDKTLSTSTTTNALH